MDASASSEDDALAHMGGAAAEDEVQRLEGDALEACLALQTVPAILACRRVSSAWREAAQRVLSSSAWQAGVALRVLLDNRAPAAAVRARLAVAPSEAHEPDSAGWPPLHRALQRRASAPVIAALLEYDAAAPRVRDPGKLLPLHVAANSGATAEVMRLLLDAYARAAHEFGKGSRLPLHYAAACTHLPADALQALLAANPAAAFARAHGDCLPLHLASSTSRASPETVRALLRCAPAAAREPGRDGMLPLHLAARHGAPSSVVRLLLSEYPEGARVTDRSGALPLHVAVASRVPSVLVHLIADAFPVDASSWSLRDLLRLGTMGEPHALKKIEREPRCRQPDKTCGDDPLQAAVYYQASQAVLDALHEAGRRAHSMSSSAE
eukprot:scaffold16061_cov116-Isochrysis_galbana.AAC.5